jgi:hypothetical protein
MWSLTMPREHRATQNVALPLPRRTGALQRWQKKQDRMGDSMTQKSAYPPRPCSCYCSEAVVICPFDQSDAMARMQGILGAGVIAVCITGACGQAVGGLGKAEVGFFPDPVSRLLVSCGR